MTQAIRTTCCIVGGGPAGMMLGFLLARAGVKVAVLEKHADFLRDFRGDTIHPSTLELMQELGLLEEFLKLPHAKVETLGAQIGASRLQIADFTHLPTHCKFVALMPQWDFLDFLAAHGRRYPGFDLHMRTEAAALIEEGGRVRGVCAKAPDGELEIRADLVVACDGRHSTLRRCAGLKVDELGAPMDVLWFRVSRKDSDDPSTFGHIEAGRMMVMLNRGDYWQCAYLIRKDGFAEVQARGLDSFRRDVVALSPFLADRIGEIADWDHVKLLTVAIDRLARWSSPGLLLIGDAAHAMSPIGGVGINLAIQDAVAAANILAVPLHEGRVDLAVLQRVQERREFPARVTQAMQVFVQKHVITAVLRGGARPRPPLLAKLLGWFAPLRRIPARLVGLGVRPEHVHMQQATG
jgi:2-polyprenyl-6-methoxyphenol hydroxylase-like FAD-dependent oxidoreductase